MSSLIHTIIKVDQGLFLTINKQQRAWLNRFFYSYTNLGGVKFQTGLALFLLFVPPTRMTGVKLAYTQLIVTLVVQVFKRLTARIRPFNALESICPLRTEKDYSFPSGHTAAAFCTALVLGSFLPVLGAIWMLVAMLVAYSRIYVGVHYPSDVLAGGIIGIGITSLLI